MKKIILLSLLPFLIKGQCQVEKTSDKFSEITRVRTTSFNWARVVKAYKGTDTTYMMTLHAEGFSANYGKNGVVILLDSGKINRPDVKVDCKYRENSMYDYFAVFTLTENELNILRKKNITAFQLYSASRDIPEKKALKLKDNINCLVKEN